MLEPMDVDLLGAIFGTDKSSSDNDYLRHYHRLFSDLRREKFNFLEIGIFRGASLATWSHYFDNATIIGVDIQQSCRQYAADRVVVEIGSQDDPGFLSDVVRRYPPRVVIDDGSHLAHHVIFTFEALFPALERGGIYVVEDLHFHAGPMREHSRGRSDVNPIDYFLQLSRTLASNELDEDRSWGFDEYARRFVDEIVFFGRAVAIHKRAPPADNALRVNTMMRMAEQFGTAEAWDRAAHFLFTNGDIGLAIEAARRGTVISPVGKLYWRLSVLHLAKGDIEAAVETARTAIERAGEKNERGEYLEHYGNILVNLGNIAQATRAFHEALDLVKHPLVRRRIEEKLARNVELTETGA